MSQTRKKTKQQKINHKKPPKFTLQYIKQTTFTTNILFLHKAIDVNKKTYKIKNKKGKIYENSRHRNYYKRK